VAVKLLIAQFSPVCSFILGPNAFYNQSCSQTLSGCYKAECKGNVVPKLN